MLRTLFIAAATALLIAIGAGLFVESGIYNIGADDHHTNIVLSVIEHLRDRSIAVRARTIDQPTGGSAASIAAGAARYSALCVACHLAPGVVNSDLRPGLYPHPPNLAAGEPEDSRRAFWIIKHGIKMSAMPAWGKTLNDAEIWDLVAFVRKMPDVTPQAYQRMLNP